MIRKALVALATATVMACTVVTPAHAVVVERVDGNCRVNFTWHEMEATNIWSPFFLNAAEVEEILPEIESDLANISERIEETKQDTSLPEWGKEMRLENLNKEKAIYTELIPQLKTCMNATSEDSAQKPALGSSNAGALAAIAGVVGAVFGAIAAIVMSLPQVQQLIPGA